LYAPPVDCSNLYMVLCWRTVCSERVLSRAAAGFVVHIACAAMVEGLKRFSYTILSSPLRVVGELH